MRLFVAVQILLTIEDDDHFNLSSLHFHVYVMFGRIHTIICLCVGLCVCLYIRLNAAWQCLHLKNIYSYAAMYILFMYVARKCKSERSSEMWRERVNFSHTHTQEECIYFSIRCMFR